MYLAIEDIVSEEAFPLISVRITEYRVAVNFSVAKFSLKNVAVFVSKIHQ